MRRAPDGRNRRLRVTLQRSPSLLPEKIDDEALPDASILWRIA
jgi:hypothetical protein